VEALLQLHRKLRAESNPTRRDALANQADHAMCTVILNDFLAHR
jgi:hypothetical protein